MDFKKRESEDTDDSPTFNNTTPPKDSNTKEDMLGSLDQLQEINSSTSIQTTFQPSEVLLFKKVPYDTKEKELKTLFHEYGVKDIFILRNKGYAFIQYKNLEAAQACYENVTKEKPIIKGVQLHGFYSGLTCITKPKIACHPPSRFLLFTFHKPMKQVTSSLLADILKPIICLKSTYQQAFVELATLEDGIYVKEEFDGAIIDNSLYITVYFAGSQQFNSKANENQGNLKTQQYYPSQCLILSPQLIPRHPVILTSMIPNQSPIIFCPATPYIYQPNQIIHPGPDMQYCDISNSPKFTHDYEKTFPDRNNLKDHELTNGTPQATSKFVLVKNLPKGSTPLMLFRLFGLYGNVLKVKIFFKNQENALIEYQDETQANAAIKYLNQCPLYGSILTVKPCFQDLYIDTKILANGKDNLFIGDFTHSKEHRYKIFGSKNCLNMGPPSKVLHLSNLQNNLTEDFYEKLFKSTAKILKFHYLKGNKKMALVEFESLEKAIEIIIKFHNYNIDGKLLKVSFSKYQQFQVPTFY